MSIKFSTTDSSIVFQEPADLCIANVSGVTLCGWIKATSFPNASNESDIYFLSTVTGTNFTRAKISIYPNPSSSSGQILMKGRCLDGDTLQSFSGSSGLVPVNTWCHIAGLFDYTNKRFITYFNGAIDATSGVLTLGNAPTSNTASDTEAIGGEFNGSSASVKVFNGLIEDCRVYNRLLSAGELLTIYNCKGKDNIVYGLKHKYNLIEGYKGVQISSSSNVIRDYGSLKLNMQQFNEPYWDISILNHYRRIYA